MEEYIYIDKGLLKFIIDQEIRKLTGKTLKRFELSDDKEQIKKQVKEIQYEWARDLRDLIILNSKSKDSVLLTKKEL
jgi:hypothetical protein